MKTHDDLGPVDVSLLELLFASYSCYHLHVPFIEANCSQAHWQIYYPRIYAREQQWRKRITTARHLLLGVEYDVPDSWLTTDLLSHTRGTIDVSGNYRLEFTGDDGAILIPVQREITAVCMRRYAAREARQWNDKPPVVSVALPLEAPLTAARDLLVDKPPWANDADDPVLDLIDGSVASGPPQSHWRPPQPQSLLIAHEEQVAGEAIEGVVGSDQGSQGQDHRTARNDESDRRGDSWVSAADVAKELDLDANGLKALGGRLKRWRRGNETRWMEFDISERGPRGPKFLYRRNAIESVIRKQG